ncbi:MAG: OsmC family protein [Planctomycetota bacterium]|jgi:uncharacterized OsmC-like protein
MAEQQTINTISGVNVEALKETIGAVTNDPELGKSRFHIHKKWLCGTHNRGTTMDFYTAKQTCAHKQAYTVDADEPVAIGGQDEGANPVEHLLNSLGACLGNSLVSHAAARGIQIEELECDIRGELDLNGYLGLSDDVRKGYQNISVNFKLKTDEPDSEKLVELAKFSPVFDTVTNGTSVDVNIERK